MIKRFLALAVLAGATLLGATTARAETISFNYLSHSYDSGSDTTTFTYDVVLQSNSNTPGYVTMYDFLGYVIGSKTFNAAPGVLAVVTEQLEGIDVPLTGATDASDQWNFTIDFTSIDAGVLSLGTFSATSTLNKLSTLKSIQVESLDLDDEGEPQVTLSSARGPSESGVSTTPLPAAAFGGLALFGLMGIKRKRSV